MTSEENPSASSDQSVFLISEGPDRVGEQLLLSGADPLTIGAAPENSIVLVAEGIAAHQARVTREERSWRFDNLSDDASLTINDASVSSSVLKTGDVIRIGPYELEYAAFVRTTFPKRPPRQTAPTAAQLFSAPPPSLAVGGVTCLSCGRSLPMDAKICVDCGINLKTGKPLLTARGVDENELYVRTDLVVKVISWILPFGLYPVASEGFGSRRPYTIGAIAVLTLLSTFYFWNRNLSAPEGVRADQSLMLWAGRAPASVLPGNAQLTSNVGQFHSWQLFTYAALHDGILPLAECLVFLLVLGSRVNGLIGQLKTAVLYVTLVFCTGVFYLLAQMHRPLHPIVGSSGAVMGIAGVYLVLFPAHRVHSVAWVRTGMSSGFRLAHNVFAVPGIFVVLFYLALDALLTLLDDTDAGTRWLHFGGFVIGIVIALVLLLSRLVDARRGDLISVSLGRRAWWLLGKPNQQSPRL